MNEWYECAPNTNYVCKQCLQAFYQFIHYSFFFIFVLGYAWLVFTKQERKNAPNCSNRYLFHFQLNRKKTGMRSVIFFFFCLLHGKALTSRIKSTRFICKYSRNFKIRRHQLKIVFLGSISFSHLVLLFILAPICLWKHKGIFLVCHN